jgi:hypothetical protein
MAGEQGELSSSVKASTLTRTSLASTSLAELSCSTVSSHDVDCYDNVKHDCLYEHLVGSSDTPVLFGWWPTAHGWNYEELTERTTRCLPAVRPGKDLVALPRLPEVEELWACWAEQCNLLSWQVAWFSPNLAIHKVTNDYYKESPKTTCQEVLTQIMLIPDQISLDSLAFYPMYLTQEIQQVAQDFGVRVVGDTAQNPLGPLCSAKAWLHPHINSKKRGPSLRSTLKAELSGARGPIGYISSSTEELLQAFHALTSEMPVGTRFVLKPSWASGGDGIIVDVSEEQLGTFMFPAEEHCTAILEELIEGIGELQSPTLYMVGSLSCGPLADQILAEGGTVNEGNRWPSDLPEGLTQTCIEAARTIQQVWGLTSNWGLDFVIDRQGTPVIVDLNMGRPNGNLAVRMWESISCQQLFLHSSSWLVPKGLAAKVLFQALQTNSLAWDAAARQGVVVYQHFQGQSCSYVIASASGWEAVDELLEKLLKVFEEIIE